MTDIYLITGFLGSGKTTFLNGQLSQSDKRVGVLMNEFGKISMDTIAIENNDVDLLELKNGSIFCACLKDKFIDGLKVLVEMDLEEIYIEGSGLADPSDMNKVIEVLGKLVEASSFTYQGAICLVDSLYFDAIRQKMVSVERQVIHSHYVVINKADLVDEATLVSIKSTVKAMNPKAKIITTSHGKVSSEDLRFEYFYIEDEETTNRKDNKPKNLVVKFIREPEVTQLEAFLTSINPYFYRIKGFVAMGGTWHKVDSVNDRIDIHPYDVRGKDLSIDGYNELVCLTSSGLASISKLARVAEKELTGLYTIQM